MLSLLYGPTLTSVHDYWKNYGLTAWAFVHKVMSLLFNTLSRFVIAFLPRSKHLLTSWLQSPSAVILEPIVSPFVMKQWVRPGKDLGSAVSQPKLVGSLPLMTTGEVK